MENQGLSLTLTHIQRTTTFSDNMIPWNLRGSFFMKTLYVWEGDGCLITHDGHMQLGVFHHTLEEHRDINRHIHWQEVYWLPDPLGLRYKRVNFQATQRVQDKFVLE